MSKNESAGVPEKFRRGRTKGKKLSEYEKNKRPNTGRISLSIPIELKRVLEAMASQTDLTKSQMFRAGLDQFVALNAHMLTDSVRAEYRRIRRKIDSGDWAGLP